MADKYKAFLSYASPDRALALQLHRNFERLAKHKWWDLRARRVFLDRVSEVPSDNLWAKVEAALGESEYFVVLASPHAAASAWVQREVEWWRKHKGCSKLLIVLASGSINWDAAANDFTPATGDKPTDALPPACRAAFTQEPQWLLAPTVRSRFASDRRGITDCAAAVVATLENIDKEKVLKREAQHRRRLAVAATGLTAAALVGVTVAYLQQQRADQESKTRVALDLASEATTAMSESHLVERGALLALESLRRVHLPENDAALRRALALLPRSVARQQHPSRVFSVAMSRSGRLFATGDRDGVTRVFTLPEITLVAEGKQGAQVFELAFSPDDSVVVAASGDGSVRTIDVASGNERWTARSTGRAIAIATSSDGKFVATGTDKQRVMVLDLSSGRTTWETTADGFVETVAFSPDSRFLAAAGGGTLHVFDVSSGHVIHASKEPVRGVAFSPDGRRLAAIGENVNVLAVGTWATETAFEAPKQSRVAFARDGSRLASTGTDGIVHIWHVGERREIARFSLGVPSVPMWLAFSPNGSTLASGWWDKTARILDALMGTEQWRVVHDSFVLAGAFSPNGRYLVTGGDDGVARVSETPAGGAVTMPGLPHLSVPFIISPDGHQLAAVREDRVLRLLDRESGATIKQITIGGQTTALKFMPDGERVVLAVKDQGVRLLDARSERVVWQVPVRGEVDGVAVSPRGTSVAVAGWTGELMMLDAHSGASLWTGAAGGVLLGVVFSGDGRRVTTIGMPPESRVVDAATGTVVWRRQTGATSAAALSDDGAMLALALADQSVRIYRLEDDQEILRVRSQGTIVALALSPDGRRLAVGGNDRNARVFDIASGVEQIRIPHDDAVWEVGFTKDGRLWTNEGYNVVRWHAVDADALIAEACSRLSRSLTQDEWARYLRDEPYREQCHTRQ